MFNILVTGAGGQLGSEIKELSSSYQYKFFFTDRDELDITDKNDISKFVEDNNIDIIINCAAYTAVDKAEENVDNANLINHQAVKYLAEIAKKESIKLIHISTDYVFDGENYKPYVETDKVNPQSVYGKTKLDGERVLQKINPENSIIIRTSWVYSSYGSNFVKTMLKLGTERDSLDIIFDQIGTPTYAKDLAKTILDIFPKIINEDVEMYHYSNEGVVSWFDFAKEIIEVAELDCKINPIETYQYPTPATRPHYSLLNKVKIKETFKITIPYWRDSLFCCLKLLDEK